MPFLLKDADYPVGGATIEWYAWIKGLEANNCEVGVLTWKGAEKYVGNNESINLVEAYDPAVGIRKFRWLYYRYPILYKTIKSYNPDFIIQECAGFNTGIMAYIGKKLNIPFIYRIANDIDTDGRLTRKLNYRQRLFFTYGLKHSSAIFCQNTYQFDNIKSKFPYVKRFIIHNPFYHRRNLPKIKKHSERSYIAWIGIFQYQKNLPVLYEIVKRMPEVEFRIAGKSENSELDKDTVIALEGLKQHENVKFVGYLKRTDVLPFLSRAYALLNTSHYEGFSNTYLESLATGTPIVTTTKADPDNIIRHNKLGIVADNFHELDYALNKVINNKQYDMLSKRYHRYLLEYHETISLSRKFIKYLKCVI